MENISFKESARELRNPGRGFYNLYRFMISDEKENYWQLVQQLYREDTGTSLTLVEINLQQYRDAEISEAGMVNITSLFVLKSVRGNRSLGIISHIKIITAKKVKWHVEDFPFIT